MLNKKVVCLVMILFLAFLLTACGGGTDKSATEPEQKGNTEEIKEEENVKGTITYEGVNGTVEISENPERVVVIADSYVGYFLALGIVPVGISDSASKNPYFEGKLEGVEVTAETPSVEMILELNPDLIVTFPDLEIIEQLEKIAPTVEIQYGAKEMRLQLKEFGFITGREEQAEAWITKWEKLIAEHKDKVVGVVGDQTVSILQPHAKGIYVFGHNFARGGEILYGEFGLKAPEIVQTEVIDSGVGWGDLSLEKLPEFAGDFIFTSAWSGDDANPEAVYGSSIWQGLEAVKNNRVFELDREASFFNDPVSLEEQLGFFVDCLTK